MSGTQQHFAELFDRSKKLRSRYLNTLAAFRIYDRFKKLSAPNFVGKNKAEASVKIFNDYRYFFSPVQEASRCYFFIELAKFFDENKRGQSLTINTVLEYAQMNIKSFSEVEFLKYHNERSIIPELLKTYKPLAEGDVNRIQKRVTRNKKLIDDLKTYRDQYLAHDDLKKNHISINATQIKTLLRIVQDTIDLLYRKLDFASNSYGNFDKEPVVAVDRVVKGLQEYEKERLRKIKEKYGL